MSTTYHCRSVVVSVNIGFVCQFLSASLLSVSCLSVSCHKTIFCGCTARFVSDLVGNPEDRFSHDAAYIKFQMETVWHLL